MKKLIRVEDRVHYPVSFAQRGMFLMNDDRTTILNSPSIIALEGKLDSKKIRNNLKELINRHEVFRTYFDIVDDQPVQKIMSEFECEIPILEIEREKELEEIHAFIQPFNLTEGPLFRSAIFKTNEDRHILVMDKHHIISDGTSMEIFFSELAALYKGETLEENEFRYRDYAVWLNEVFESGELLYQENYWKKQFSGEIPVLNLPQDVLDWQKIDTVGKNIKFTVSKELTDGLKAVVKKFYKTKFITLHTVVFSIYMILLSRYSGQEDITTGFISNGRTESFSSKIIGPFIKVLPLRVKVDSEKRIIDFFGEMSTAILEAYEHQDYPYEKILEYAGVSRGSEINPLFNTMFIYHMNGDLDQIKFGDIKIESIQYQNSVGFGLKTDVYPQNTGELVIEIEYNPNLMNEDRMEAFKNHFIKITEAVLDDPNIILSDINILTDGEKETIWHKFNDNKKVYPEKKSLIQLIEEQVSKTPDSIAVVCEEKKLSFSELNNSANHIARLLINQGIGEGSVVGIMVERSVEMISGILGILKTGAAYLPIASDYPKERIEYILNHSKVAILLSKEAYKKELNEWKGTVISLDAVTGDSQNYENICAPYNPEQVMYVLYTSGSTGNPKGAMVKANSFVNLMNWYTKTFEMNEDDNMLLIAPVSFDLAQKNLYATLLTGGTLHLYPPKTYDYNHMVDLVEKNRITFINCTPSAFYPVLEFAKNNYKRIESLRYVFLGGEPISNEKIQQWLRSEDCRGKIVNTYGPTECTDITTSYVIKLENIENDIEAPIGKSIDNVDIFILDKWNNSVPIGVPGELCIAGTSLSKGYCFDSELTKEKFVQIEKIPANEVYRTGDLVKWLPDGNIQFCGRIDHQVKIRGYRIELGEIESVINQHPRVDQSIVVVNKKETSESRLIAYVVLNDQSDEFEIRKHLSKSLPEYMVPEVITFIKEIPLNPNGKIDRKYLSELNQNLEEIKVLTEPTNELEEQLLELWKDVLGLDLLGTTENLLEKGANSLKLIVGTSHISKKFGVQIPLVDMFRLQNITQISAFIEEELSKNQLEENISIEDIEFDF